MNKILCIGEALIDMICTDKGKSLADGQHFLKKPGGAPTNAAAAIAALGGKAALAAKVGNDPFGNQLISVMKDFGVSVKWILKDNHHFTTLAFVSLMEDGERDFVFSRGADGHLSSEDIKDIDLTEFSIIHFGSATGFLPGPLQTAYAGLLQEALLANKYISFDPNYRHLLFRGNTKSFIDQSWNFIQSCHFFKMSDEEALLVTGTSAIEKAVSVLSEKTKSVFAITLGKEGTLLRYENKMEIVPSIKVKSIDSTGAGDAFIGAVLYQLGDKSLKEINVLTLNEWKAIIFNANKAGARTCEYMGAMEAYKHLSNDIFK